MRKLTFIFTWAVFMLSCTNQEKKQQVLTTSENKPVPPHLTILSDLPDSLQPKITYLANAAQPKTISVPTGGSRTYTPQNTNGKIKLMPPTQKFLPVLRNSDGTIIRDGHDGTFVMGEGGTSNFRYFTTDNGLALDGISCSMMDSKGNLWFGTWGGGISRYDGKSFTNFSVDQGLVSSLILSIAEDADGNLWFGTLGSGVCRYDGRTFTTFTTANGMSDNTVWSILPDTDGNIWFGTASGVSYYDGKNATSFASSHVLANKTVMCIAEDKFGNLWFGTVEGGVSKYGPNVSDKAEENSFTTYTTDSGLANNVVLCICPDKAGKIWIGTYGGGASCYDGKTFTTYTVDSGLANNQVLSIIESYNGDLWFSTEGGGVCRYDGTSFTSYSKDNGLSNDAVKSITEDRKGNLWLGTFGNGIISYDGKAFRKFSQKHGLSNYKINCIAEDDKNNLWFGTDDSGVCCFDGRSFTTYTINQGLAENSVLGITKDSKGNLWFGTNRGGVSCFDGHAFTTYATANGLANYKVMCIKEDRNGTIWFGTYEGGLCRFDGKSFTTFSVAQGLANDKIMCIAEDNEGALWCGTYGGGVSRFDGKSFLTYAAGQGLASDNVYSIIQDKKGNLWLGTEAGLNVISAEDLKKTTILSHHPSEGKSDSFGSPEQGNVFLRKFSKSDGLPNDFVTQVIELPDGRIAVGTNKGIATFTAAENLTQLSNVKNFNSATGYPVKDINVGQPGMIVDSKGVIWAGTGAEKTALVRFDPGALLPDTLSPIIVVSGIKINQENISWNSLGALHSNPKETQPARATIESNVSPTYITEEYNSFGRILTDVERDSMKTKFGNITFDSISRFYPTPKNLVLPYRHNNITIEFNAIETGRPEMVTYSYILEGYDKEWSPALKTTSATYGNIGEGTYTFKVRARVADASWSQPATYTFEVLPPWYRTWLAYLIYILLFIAALRMFSKWRERSLRKDKEVLENTVNQRTEELVQKNIVVEQQKAEVEKEKMRSEKLLLNILPEEVAEELKSTGTTVAKYYDDVTVIFTDFENFTHAAERMSPQALINELDICFSKFDEITAKYNIEKIKTIGDAYLAVAGIPIADPKHAENAINAAREINAFMEERKARLGDSTFGIRIGIHSGSIVAGVVGLTKFAYDIWGDTVNIAARMEQNSESGKINISHTTYELVKNKFTCNYRGEHEVKGKGYLRMYYL